MLLLVKPSRHKNLAHAILPSTDQKADYAHLSQNITTSSTAPLTRQMQDNSTKAQAQKQIDTAMSLAPATARQSENRADNKQKQLRQSRRRLVSKVPQKSKQEKWQRTPY
ncbi:hypothetical protein [Dickeya chrysanthemi]|uniref:hypothetical protein n=1 Tax=Dickeya chrysanthemi TaxID=556 RepID=UPI0012DBDF59|nr:hypothetical protein [Dickeya chrysanthemi]